MDTSQIPVPPLCFAAGMQAGFPARSHLAERKAALSPAHGVKHAAVMPEQLVVGEHRDPASPIR